MNISELKGTALGRIEELKQDLARKKNSEQSWMDVAKKATEELETLKKQYEGYDLAEYVNLKQNYSKLSDDYIELKRLWKEQNTRMNQLATENYRLRTQQGESFFTKLLQNILSLIKK